MPRDRYAETTIRYSWVMFVHSRLLDIILRLIDRYIMAQPLQHFTAVAAPERKHRIIVLITGQILYLVDALPNVKTHESTYQFSKTIYDKHV